MSRFLHTSGLVLTFLLPTFALLGCGGGSTEPAPIAGESLKIGDDSPLNDYNPDAN